MAPKFATPAPKSAAPASSSASSYTSSGSGEEEEEEDVQVSPPQNRPAAAPKPSSKAPIEEDSSTGDYCSSDDPAASDSDDVAEPSPPAKPLASPPPAAATSHKKKRKEAPPPPPENNNDESGGGGGVDGQKKRLRFQRLWSEADEIAILHGMLNHQTKTGALPSKTDMSAFRDSIHKNLTTDINIRQLTEKVRRLKKKYDKNPSTASSGKPHDSAIHELSHKIWGASNAAKVKPRYNFLKHAVTGMGGCLPCSVTLEEVLDSVDDSKATAIEESLKKSWKLQLKNQAREMEIKKETNMVLMEALEKMG